MKVLQSFFQAPFSWLSALFLWPKFSVTSFSMVSNLARQGIVPKTIIDVGANVGQFAVSVLKIFPGATLYSFEPNPNCVIELRKNTSQFRNVVVYPLALGDKEGETTFNVNSYSHSSSILHLTEDHLEAFPSAREIESIQVKVSTLDKVLEGIELVEPVLLKVDVQGYEAKTLYGAANVLRHVDYVVMEVSFKPMYQGEALFMELAHLMEMYGFSFRRPIDFLTDPHSGEIIQMDALFERNIA